jgi:hypothetical protein
MPKRLNEGDHRRQIVRVPGLLGHGMNRIENNTAQRCRAAGVFRGNCLERGRGDIRLLLRIEDGRWRLLVRRYLLAGRTSTNGKVTASPDIRGRVRANHHRSDPQDGKMQNTHRQAPKLSARLHAPARFYLRQINLGLSEVLALAKRPMPGRHTYQIGGGPADQLEAVYALQRGQQAPGGLNVNLAIANG